MDARFRFRAWSKQLQRYCNIDEMPVSSLAETNSDLIIEQCTGLKDKNGRLIYEGDIIAARFQGELFTANIKYFRAGWVAEFHYWKPSLYQMCTEAKFEVIGNIHENPELLEVKK